MPVGFSTIRLLAVHWLHFDTADNLLTSGFEPRLKQAADINFLFKTLARASTMSYNYLRDRNAINYNLGFFVNFPLLTVTWASRTRTAKLSS